MQATLDIIKQIVQAILTHLIYNQFIKERGCFMTISEKLQYYRKKAKMSQEELGGKLLVSRQTISLWETGQTLPTIDNLIKLKEIFKVSLDELLCEASENISVEAPRESHTFTYSQDDLKKIYKSFVGDFLKKAILWSTISIICWLWLFGNDTDYNAMCFLLGMILTLDILYFKNYKLRKKFWKKRENALAINEYTYNVYDDYLIFEIRRNTEIVRKSMIYYTAIDKVNIQKGYYCFDFEGQSFTVKKSVLGDDSILSDKLTKLSYAPRKEAPKKATGIWNVVSWVLFVSSVLSIFIASGFISITTTHINHIEEMWRMFLFLPIPLASIVLGIFFKKRGWKAKKNIIVGITMTVVLLIFGAFSFAFDDFFDYSDAHIVMVEEYTGIDIPQHNGVMTEDWTTGTQTVARGYVYYSTKINFDYDIAQDFEAQLLGDERWLSQLPNELVGVLSSLNYTTISEYTLLYNVDTGEFNTVPSENGTYRFVSLFYSTEHNEMKIIEYDLEYIA